MRTRTLFLLLALPLALAAQQRNVKSISWQRIEIDKSYDMKIDPVAKRTMEIYKQKVDSVMAPTLGLSRKNMSASRPESLLSNWAADMVVDECTCTGLPKADFGLLNMGGLRADMPDGEVTVGNAYLIAPFENSLCVVELKGSDVMELMRNIASVGGEAVSSSVRLNITKDNKLIDATIGGEPIDPNRTYTIATIDYLAAGNDKMVAMKKNTKVHYLKVLLRDAMMENIIKRRVIDSELDGRITVK